jgi:hypothetical protein
MSKYKDVVLMIPFEIDAQDFASMHDCIIDATGESLNQDELVQIFNKLPNNIKGQAFSWGLGDTDVRGQIFKWIKKK